VPDPIDVVVLAHNRPDYLEQMIDALEERTRWPYRLTIVDNASAPETREWLRQQSPRLHRIIWNARNEHLAGHERGIAATTSELFVLSDADLVPHPPDGGRCWLTRLVELAERHPDFGLISARLDTLSDARNRHLETAPSIDGELIETAPGVWLNLIRRSALRIPYMGDGVTAYALRRSGYRVGIASDVWCTHLGDQDPLRHPQHIASKQAGLGVVYPRYPELASSRRPPLLGELALAAPLLAALEHHGIDPAEVVELSRERWPPLSAVEPSVEAAVRGRRVAAARFVYEDVPPVRPGGAGAIALCGPRHDQALLDDALGLAREWIVLLTAAVGLAIPPGWSLVAELPGPHPVIWRVARIASRRRWRRALGYSTSEHGSAWLSVMRAACFGERPALRAYVLRRDQPLERAPERWEPGAAVARAPRWRPRLGRRGGRLGALLTKATRLLRAEWQLHLPAKR
jgi:hypothetical protein